MSNDITALIATMKAAAEKAKHAGEAPVMDFYTRIDALNEFQLAACPANVLALVEALEKAQTRIGELERSHKTLRETMAGIHNTIRTDGGYTPLVSILNASKRAYEESAAAAGIQVIEGEGQ